MTLGPTLLPIHTGGLFRCCIDALAQYAADGGAEEEGTRVVCPHCGEGIVVAGGSWRWEHSPVVQEGGTE